MDILDLGLDEMMHGYKIENGHYTCIFCNEQFDEDEIFLINDRFYNAKKMMEQHIVERHHSVFDGWIEQDKKVTGLSDIQLEMIKFFFKGMSDQEITENSDSINSVSTVRQHRFKLREKEKQAKVFLVLMQLLKQPHLYEPIHKGATQVDERYAISAEKKEKVLQTYFKNGLDKGIETIPSKEMKKIIILQHILKRFEKRRKYSEKEVNDILKGVHVDYVSLRRYLIEYGFMERTDDCSTYWVKE